MTPLEVSTSCGGSLTEKRPVQQGDGGSTPTPSLQILFRRIPNKLGAKLNAQWHSVLPSIPVFHIQIAFGAFLPNGDCCGVSLWGRPVARTICGKGWLELRRMALSPQAPKNTASKMLGWMGREIPKLRPDINRFISYQDTEHHKGTIYRAAGWMPVDMKSSPVNWGGASQTKTPPSRERKTKILKAPKIRWERKLRELSI